MTDDMRSQSEGTRGRRRGDPARWFWGLAFILVGTWFFIERTLRIDLPAIPWGDIWPVVLIGLGIWIVSRGASRRGT